MPDSQKLEALTSRFQPSKGWKAPLCDFGKKNRRVLDFVFDEALYPFFMYSPSLDEVFCAPCAIFSQASNTLVARAKESFLEFDI